VLLFGSSFFSALFSHLVYGWARARGKVMLVSLVLTVWELFAGLGKD
jgi:hypothetical protein